jgi:uncharacterized protein YdiU (UPF0061 family)
MQEQRADYTNTLRALSRGEEPAGLSSWITRWHARLDAEGRARAEALRSMRAVNPAVIPRNHRVEEALLAAEEHFDLAPLRELVSVLATPFDLAPEHAKYAEPPPPEFANYCTFCGT